ncbi:MAG TPA: alpha/beta hydrolase [Jatrophihabitans sp.]|nr:alpha/beta hydrolase [Jatrophihabitans sp.]
MAVFVLIPGAGGNAGYWSRLVPELVRRGHEAIPVDIRQDDPELHLRDWATAVEAATAGRPAPVLVAQSLGGFLVPLVATRVHAAMVVLLNAMIPLPGETPDEWWGATGSGAARRAADEAAGRDPEFDLDRHFLHDLDDAARTALFAETPREPSATAMADACAFERWPDIPTRVLVAADDRFFPLEFQRRVARERLGLDADVIDGGHLVAVSRPGEIADRLAAYAAG